MLRKMGSRKRKNISNDDDIAGKCDSDSDESDRSRHRNKGKQWKKYRKCTWVVLMENLAKFNALGAVMTQPYMIIGTMNVR